MGDVTEFGSLNHSPGKRILNNLKMVCLRFWKKMNICVSKNLVTLTETPSRRSWTRWSRQVKTFLSLSFNT